MTRRTTAVAVTGALVGALLLPAPALAADPTTTDLVISEYAEGSGFNKAVELYNGTGADLDISGYELRLYSNGRPLADGPTGTYTLPAGTVLADGAVWTVTNSGYALTPGGTIDATNNTAVNFNGNDALTVVDDDGSVVDSFGEVGDDAVFAANVTLRRTDFTADTIPDDPWTNDAFEAFPSDTSDDIGVSPTGDDGGGDDGGGDDGEVCDTADEDLTLISEIQGRAAPSGSSYDGALAQGTEVTIRAVVTLADDDLGGYFVQEEPDDVDAFDDSSEGLFVFEPGALPVEGQTVELTGGVTAFFGLTQLSRPDTEVCDVELVAIAPTPIALPLDAVGREAFESMLVTNAQDLEVGGLFTAYRFGELGLQYPAPLPQPTSVYAPGTPEAAALTQLNADSELKVNDRDEAFGQFNPFPWELFDEDLSAGDTMPAGRLVGALNYSFGQYKVEPVDNEVGDPSDRIFFPETENTAPTPDAPELADGNDVVSFNVLNYFNTFGDSAELRGAENAEDFAVQTAKIVDAIIEMDAAVYGLIELENDYEEFYDDDPTTVPAIVTLVEELNAVAGEGTFAYVQPDQDQLTDEGFGGLGPDAIAQGFVYQPARAEPVGPARTFDIDALLTGDEDNNRWPLAQTFKVDKEFVEVVVNHFKSKGSSCTDTAGPGFELGDDVGTVDTANCNLVREYAAQRLIDWVEDGATGFPTDDVLLIGDFNAYEEEQPIEILVEAGYVDLVQVLGDDAFTYKFSGRYGRLDYAFANQSLVEKVTDTEVWQINSRAPVGYLYFNDPIDLEAEASSDHDPVIVSLVSDGKNGASGKGRKPRG